MNKGERGQSPMSNISRTWIANTIASDPNALGLGVQVLREKNELSSCSAFQLLSGDREQIWRNFEQLLLQPQDPAFAFEQPVAYAQEQGTSNEKREKRPSVHLSQW
jgi:hypothetical protein